jgi:hypothetical protein
VVKNLEDRKGRGSLLMRPMCGLVDKRSKGQTWRTRKHGCENGRGCVSKRQGQGSRKPRSQERLLLRQVNVKKRGQNEATGKQEDERSEGNIGMKM